MTVKVILWGSEELLKQAKGDGLEAGNAFYEKKANTLIEYRWIDSDEDESIRKLLSKQGKKFFIVIEQLTKKKLEMLMAYMQNQSCYYFFIKEEPIWAEVLAGARFKHWCFLPFFHHELFSALIVDIAFKEESLIEETLQGGTILVGETSKKAGAGELMQALFKGWQYVEKRKHVKLDLYCDQPLALELLSEVEDAACQYIQEESLFYLEQHESPDQLNRLYFRISAF